MTTSTLKFHATGAALACAACVLAINNLPLMAALALYCAFNHAKCER